MVAPKDGMEVAPDASPDGLASSVIFVRIIHIAIETSTFAVPSRVEATEVEVSAKREAGEGSASGTTSPLRAPAP